MSYNSDSQSGSCGLLGVHGRPGVGVIKPNLHAFWLILGIYGLILWVEKS